MELKPHQVLERIIKEAGPLGASITYAREKLEELGYRPNTDKGWTRWVNRANLRVSNEVLTHQSFIEEKGKGSAMARKGAKKVASRKAARKTTSRTRGNQKQLSGLTKSTSATYNNPEKVTVESDGVTSTHEGSKIKQVIIIFGAVLAAIVAVAAF